MRLLITGHDGFTGRYLETAAQAAGYVIKGLSANLCDADAVHAEVLNFAPSHVVHLAAISSVTHNQVDEFYTVNQLGSLHLLRSLAALSSAPQKIILASSAYVYGAPMHKARLAESDVPAPHNHYAISKYAMELIAATFVPNLPIVLTRPFNYTGVGHDERFVVPKIIAHFASGASRIELGNLDTEREYNDVRDVVAIYLRLLERGEIGQTYNIASGRAVSIRTILSNLSALTGHTMAVEQNPSLVRTQEVASLAGDSQKLTHCIGPLAWRPLSETLDWMLYASRAALKP